MERVKNVLNKKYNASSDRHTPACSCNTASEELAWFFSWGADAKATFLWFSFEVEYILEGGNQVFERSGKTLKLTRLQKYNILEKMAEKMHSFKPYPNDREIVKAGEALITAQPCLRELGSDSGWYG